MKKVRVIHEAIIDDSKLKTEDDVIAEGYEDIEDAIISDGLEGVIEGSYEYRIDWEISDTEDGYFCEWRLCDEEANVYDTDCRNPHILIEGTPHDNNYVFCPYCGRKIKNI